MDIRTQANHGSHLSSNQPEAKGRHKKLLVVITSVLLVIIIAIATLLAVKLSSPSAASAIEKGSFQAVFLTNGQVYFGKLANVDGEYLKLENIYYLQVQQSVQPSTEKPQQSATDPNSEVSLTKLGQELHGPTDEMHILKDQVLFWENLKGDSTVVKAINDYEKN